MRFGILLILLQSMLLCAEGRAESQSVQLDSADKVVRVLLHSGNQQQQEETDSAALAPPQPRVFPGALAAPIASLVAFPSSSARAAHTIRGPPARQ
ncbi:hypothetical protein ACONUD_13040 [Microbulbifer harenosus]|uniref:Uncharacterized protein n=1 Tax=Microbulbifer harenosus TaxID=2576840 RepID=A0ABY2UJJ3_9GAMM|nr:hypothetical protein [Microbulbifer harenosus]TLM77376.1 hypothetical protein FDY93_10645 [Microbulbifer harenosus]